MRLRLSACQLPCSDKSCLAAAAAPTEHTRGRMALVETALPPEALQGDAWGALSPGAALTLSAPGLQPLQVAHAHTSLTHQIPH